MPTRRGSEDLNPRLRESAERVMSLNLGDLDIQELDRRLQLVQRLGTFGAAGMTAPEAGCTEFHCGIY